MTPMLLDIGTGELFALVVLAAVLLGPEKVPELSRKAARVLRFLRRVANTATDQIKAELGPEYADLDIADLNPKNLKPMNLVQKVLPSDVQTEMESLRAELAGMKADMARLQRDTEGDLKAVEGDVREAEIDLRRLGATRSGASGGGTLKSVTVPSVAPGNLTSQLSEDGQ